MTKDEQTSKRSDNLNRKKVNSAVICFAGDSGDGMQTVGTLFSLCCAASGHHINTLPVYPSEIRPPTGSIAGVSSFQANVSTAEINTPGDKIDYLFALNPAALKVYIPKLRQGAVIVINRDAFTETTLKKAGLETNPCDDLSFISKYKVINAKITSVVEKELSFLEKPKKSITRSQNFFVLGLALNLFNRKGTEAVKWIEEKFEDKPDLAEINKAALQRGLDTATKLLPPEELGFISKGDFPPGTYRSIDGTEGIVFGLLAAANRSQLPMFYGAYPITPASDILHQLAKQKHLNVTTMQMEDEIAAVCASLGASFAGHLAVTGSSGPGISLKAETLGLAVMTELPLVIINVQRAGPATGMPTKTEQSDLFQALYGRHGEAPMCVVAVSSPANAFDITYKACRIALKYMTPVMILSDAFITHTMQPWRIPDIEELAKITPPLSREHNNPGGDFLPYKRDAETLARPWVVPGTPALMHRVGGLEKENETGTVTYDPDNHELMCKLRAEKIERIQAEMDPLKLIGEDSGDVLLIGWGGTKGSIKDAVRVLQSQGHKVSSVHIHFLSPLPKELDSLIRNFKHVIVPELNRGQLRMILRDKYLIDIKGLNKVAGTPFTLKEIQEAVLSYLE